jgi:hypothetical protein
MVVSKAVVRCEDGESDKKRRGCDSGDFVSQLLPASKSHHTLQALDRGSANDCADEKEKRQKKEGGGTYIGNVYANIMFAMVCPSRLSNSFRYAEHQRGKDE